MRLILILLILAGVLIAIQPAFDRAKITQLISDMKMFEARVSERTDGKDILALGGESRAEHFEDLIQKLYELETRKAAPLLGVTVSLLSAVALALDVAKKRTVEPSDGANATLGAPRSSS